MPTSSKPPHGRQQHAATATVSTASTDTAVWQAALAGMEERHTTALAALKESHGNRLARLEERLAASESATADLGGQIREMR